MGIEEAGVYGQIAGIGVSVGINGGEGLAISVFGQGSLGAAGIVSAGITINPFDWDVLGDDDPNDHFIDFSYGTYIGAGIPPGSPVAVVGAHDPRTDLSVGSIGIGAADIAELGIYILTAPANDPLDNIDFWNAQIHTVEISDIPNAVKAEILRDLLTAREIPAYRQEVALKYGLMNPRCFPADTPIAISACEAKPICNIRVGDTVLAFDPAAGLGRGALVPRRVVRTHRNTTTEWVRSGRAESGAARAPEIDHREAREAA